MFPRSISAWIRGVRLSACINRNALYPKVCAGDVKHDLIVIVMRKTMIIILEAEVSAEPVKADWLCKADLTYNATKLLDMMVYFIVNIYIFWFSLS